MEQLVQVTMCDGGDELRQAFASGAAWQHHWQNSHILQP